MPAYCSPVTDPPHAYPPGNFRGDSTGVDRLLPLLRLLRNMCVGNEAACQHMVAARAHVTASQLVTLQTPLPQAGEETTPCHCVCLLSSTH